MVVLLAVAGFAWGKPMEAADAEANQFIDLSIEQLVEMEITSVSKKSQRLSDAAAAIYVLSSDDIRRAGVASIPEALRLVPGVEVAQIDSSKWAITARGFNGRFANKLLVLIDGRSIYSPLFSGVLWDMHDMVLEDVDRIEVIRGPGATLWGANAVNGVINIITKHSRDTQGNLVSATTGNQERANLAYRHGGTTDDGDTWRGYGKWFKREVALDAFGSRSHDEWRTWRTGFRRDGKLTSGGSFMLEGEAFHSDQGETVARPVLAAPYALIQEATIESQGLDLLGRWNRPTESGEATFQVYYDGSRFRGVVLEESRDTVDFDYQQRMIHGGHDLIWGVGYRINRDQTRPGIVAMAPGNRSDRLFSAFIQDEIDVGQALKVTLGSKLEHNGYTGWEMQPSLRALWKPASGHTAWASVSRAVRTPSMADASALVPIRASASPIPGVPVLVKAQGSEAMVSERLTAYELGWRLTPAPTLALDLTAFLNDYDRLRSQELGTPVLLLSPVPHLVQPVIAGNELKGRTYGFEAVVEARPMDHWRLVAAYSNLHFDLKTEPGSSDATSATQQAGSSPRNQLSLRSEWNLSPTMDFDGWIKHVDELRAIGVPRYTSLNLRFAWRPRHDTEISLIGQNLLDQRHLEFQPEFVSTLPTYVPRSFQAAIRFRF